jgi:hypothetical protein
VSNRTDHTLAVHATMDGVAAKEMKRLGDTGAASSGKIAAGFIKAQIAIGLVKTAAKTLVSTFKSITVDAIQSIDEIGKLSIKVGVGVETLSALGHAARLSGTDINSVATALGQLQRQMFNARAGSADATRAFAAARVEFARTDGSLRDVKEVLMDLSDWFSRSEDGAERTAVAMSLLGRSGRELQPLLIGGREALRSMIEDARRLGIEISEADFKLAAEANDAILRFTTSIQGLKMSIAKNFMPQVTGFFNKVADLIAEHRDEIAGYVNQIVTTVGNSIVDALKAVSIGIADLVDTIENFSVKKLAGQAALGWGEQVLSLGGLLWKLTPDERKSIEGYWGIEKTIGPKGKDARAAWKAIEDEVAKIKAMIAGMRAEKEGFPGDPERGGTIDVTAAKPSAWSVWWTKFHKGNAQQEGGMVQAIKDFREATSPENLGMAAVEKLSTAWSTFFDAIITGSKTAGEAFRAFAQDLMRDIMRIAQQRLVIELLSMFIGGSPSANNGNPGAAKMQHGGVVYSPRAAIVGDVPEAVIPLTQLRSVLGSAGGGGGGGDSYQLQVNVHGATDAAGTGRMVAVEVSRALKRFRGMKAALGRA